MATDGLKIIDSDVSHDTYTTIIGLFGSGLDKSAVLKQYPFKLHVYGQDLDYYHELFVTAYALAFWEIGWLDDEILTEVQKVIKNGATVSAWEEEYGISIAKKRQKILTQFLQKISKQNTRPRTIRKYKQTENAIFQKGDLIVYEQLNKIYTALLCVDTAIEKGKVWYTFTPTSYFNQAIPTIDEIIDFELYGVRIAVSGDRKSISESQNGVSALWDLYPEELFPIPANSPFLIGLVQEFVQHKNIIQFKDKFHRTGTLKLKEQFNKQGSGSHIYNIEQFDRDQEYYQIMKYYKFPIRILCET